MDVSIPATVEWNNGEKVEKYLLLAEDRNEVWRAEYVHTVVIILGSIEEVPSKLLNNVDILPKTLLSSGKGFETH